jgi:hypothetical protein
MRREQQIGEAERVPRQPDMTVEQPSDLGDADLRVGDSLDNRVFIDRPIEARRDDAIAGDRAETCGMIYQSVMPISWFIRAAARGSSGCSRGPGTAAST